MSNCEAEKIADIKYQQGDGQLLDVLQIKRGTISVNIDRLHTEQALIRNTLKIRNNQLEPFEPFKNNDLHQHN